MAWWPALCLGNSRGQYEAFLGFKHHSPCGLRVQTLRSRTLESTSKLQSARGRTHLGAAHHTLQSTHGHRHLAAAPCTSTQAPKTRTAPNPNSSRYLGKNGHHRKVAPKNRLLPTALDARINTVDSSWNAAWTFRLTFGSRCLKRETNLSSKPRKGF